MIERNPNTPRIPEIVVPEKVHLDDLFWINPSEIGSVSNVINSTRMATMALGVQSRRSEFGSIGESVHDNLVDPNDPMADEQRRAIDVGFLYGSMLVRSPVEGQDSSPATPNTELVSEFLGELGSIKSGLDLATENDNFNLFIRLRDLEVKFAGSDVLAFCLSATQDHMAYLFSAYNKTGNPIKGSEITHLQSLYYAGALTGALAKTPQELPISEVQIMRAKRAQRETLSARLEFEASDDLEANIEYQLSNKYVFRPTQDRRGKRAIAIVPGSMQYGPNISSLPVLLPGFIEEENTIYINEKKIDAVLFRDHDEEADTQTIRIQKLKTDPDYLKTKDDVKTEIVGIVSGNDYITSYDQAHPISGAIRGLITSELGKKEEDLVEFNEATIAASIDQQRERAALSHKRLTIKLMGGAALGVFVPDAIGAAIVHDYQIKWGQDAVVLTLIAALAGANKLVSRRRAKNNQEIEHVDQAIQSIIDSITLHQPKNSGNITSA